LTASQLQRCDAEREGLDGQQSVPHRIFPAKLLLGQSHHSIEATSEMSRADSDHKSVAANDQFINGSLKSISFVVTQMLDVAVKNGLLKGLRSTPLPPGKSTSDSLAAAAGRGLKFGGSRLRPQTDTPTQSDSCAKKNLSLATKPSQPGFIPALTNQGGQAHS